MQCLMRDAVKPCQEPILTPDQDPPETRDAAMRDVLVVFADAPEKKLLRGLKPGFRHCFVVMSGARAGDWICLDPQSHRVACDIWQYSVLFDPEAYYRGRGFDCVWVSYPAEVPNGCGSGRLPVSNLSNGCWVFPGSGSSPRISFFRR